MCDDLQKFGRLRFLDASAYEHSSVGVSRAHWRLSSSRATIMLEKACAQASLANGLQGKEKCSLRN